MFFFIVDFFLNQQSTLFFREYNVNALVSNIQLSIFCNLKCRIRVLECGVLFDHVDLNWQKFFVFFLFFDTRINNNRIKSTQYFMTVNSSNARTKKHGCIYQWSQDLPKVRMAILEYYAVGLLCKDYIYHKEFREKTIKS